MTYQHDRYFSNSLHMSRQSKIKDALSPEIINITASRHRVIEAKQAFRVPFPLDPSKLLELPCSVPGGRAFVAVSKVHVHGLLTVIAGAFIQLGPRRLQERVHIIVAISVVIFALQLTVRALVSCHCSSLALFRGSSWGRRRGLCWRLTDASSHHGKHMRIPHPGPA